MTLLGQESDNKEKCTCNLSFDESVFPAKELLVEGRCSRIERLPKQEDVVEMEHPWSGERSPSWRTKGRRQIRLNLRPAWDKFDTEGRCLLGTRKEELM